MDLWVYCTKTILGEPSEIVLDIFGNCSGMNLNITSVNLELELLEKGLGFGIGFVRALCKPAHMTPLISMLLLFKTCYLGFYVKPLNLNPKPPP